MSEEARMTWQGGVGLAIAVALLAAGCSGEVSFQVGGKDPQDAAEDRIESQEFVDGVGLGELTAECNDPGDVEAGDTFLCTADTESGEVIDITASIVDDETLNVRSTNLLVASDVRQVSQAAVRLLNEQNDLSLPPGAIDCGDSSIVLPDDKIVRCVFNDPATGRQYATAITIVDLDTGRIEVNVSGQPRS
jgi:hypothetical protein